MNVVVVVVVVEFVHVTRKTCTCPKSAPIILVPTGLR